MPEPSSPYIWLPDLQRYRDTATGRWASSAEVRGWGQTRMDDAADHARGMAGALAERDITLGQWERNMREQIKEQYVQQYLLGRGGRDLMTAEDWGSIGGSLAEQYSWLNKFSAQIATGELSEKQIAARSEMYLHSAREMFEKARSRAQGAPELPAYPGDGSTICLTNCRCFWELEKRPDRWLAYWRITAAESCATCIERAGEWAPYELPVG